MNASMAEMEFYAISREQYYDDCERMITNAIVKVINQIEEARK